MQIRVLMIEPADQGETYEQNNECS
jgi:hypothetical protein